MPDIEVIIDIIGEGKTDRGPTKGDLSVQKPGQGVLSNLVHSLCDSPGTMRVRALPIPFAIKGGPDKKIALAKQQAFFRMQKGQSHGLVFVIDAEGDHRAYQSVVKELGKGRDLRHQELPTAVGVALPCIESWLLADITAIKKGLKIPTDLSPTDDPESLPAPCKDRSRNPKTVLADYLNRKSELTVAEKTAIAARMVDTVLVRSRCPKSFAPFADEVVKHIKPLFADPDDASAS